MVNQGRPFDDASNARISKTVRRDEARSLLALFTGIATARKQNTLDRAQHLGDELRREQCQTCQGNVQVKLFACAVFDECTLAKKLNGIAACENGRCRSYQAATNVL